MKAKLFKTLTAGALVLGSIGAIASETCCGSLECCLQMLACCF